MTAQRAEGLAQVAIMLAIGAMAGAASFTHVHDVTVAHGQPDWIGWANATVVELMSIALGLELRRRVRTQRPTGFVAAALVFFVLVSLAAQVVDAQRSVIGWLAAALPALGFLTLAKVVLSRTSTAVQLVDVVEDQADETDHKADVPAHLVQDAERLVTAHQRTTGQPLPAAVLADRIQVDTTTAEAILDALGDHTRQHPAAARINGAALREIPA